MRAAGDSSLDRQVRLKKAIAQYVRGEMSLEEFKKVERKNAPQYVDGLRVLGAAIKREKRVADEQHK